MSWKSFGIETLLKQTSGLIFDWDTIVVSHARQNTCGLHQNAYRCKKNVFQIIDLPTLYLCSLISVCNDTVRIFPLQSSSSISRRNASVTFSHLSNEVITNYWRQQSVTRCHGKPPYHNQIFVNCWKQPRVENTGWACLHSWKISEVSFFPEQLYIFSLWLTVVTLWETEFTVCVDFTPRRFLQRSVCKANLWPQPCCGCRKCFSQKGSHVARQGLKFVSWHQDKGLVHSRFCTNRSHSAKSAMTKQLTGEHPTRRRPFEQAVCWSLDLVVLLPLLCRPRRDTKLQSSLREQRIRDHSSRK